MQAKPLIFSLCTLLFTKNYFVQGKQAMSSLPGIYSAVFVTVPNSDVAKNLAHGMVKNKIAACVNIIPQITSVYEWENKINEDNELLLMIKTRTETVENLTQYVIDNHPYTTCEVISLPIQSGSEKYLNWIGEVVPSLKKNAE